MIGNLFYINLLLGCIESFNTYHSEGYAMSNLIPKTYQLLIGWYWDTDDESDGPFANEDEALNDYVDGHPCEEE